VRQLRSTIRRAVLLADRIIDEDHLGLPTGPHPSVAESVGSYLSQNAAPLKQLVRTAIASVERAALVNALRKTGGNKARAARLLQIDYKTIHTKLKEHGLKTQGGGQDDQETE
jgi:two-component system nitrogen regulation response regulator GlnG